MRQIAILVSTFLLFFFMSPQSIAAPTIVYNVSMPAPHTHYFEVEMIVSDLDKTGDINFKLPVWAPGSYLVREFAKGIEGFEAFDKNGGKLNSQKTNKNTWQVKNKGGNVTVRYRVYAFEMSVRTSFVDDSHGYINGTSVFMYVEGLENSPSTINIIPFKGWKTVSTSLNKNTEKEFSFSAANYDELVDSPIEIGNHLVFNFMASGVNHMVAMYGPGNFNVERLKKDMSTVVEACTSVFGENPNEEYTFIIHNLDKGSGGLEHTKSTSLQVNRWTYGNEKYIGFLSLVAHEYFHLWNVKRIRPFELGPFNYDKENYTRSLWVMEGFTSYYDELLLLKAGLVDENYYFDKLKKSINYLENLPGNDVQPVTEASFDAWIKAYRPNENSRNTTISYYTKGSIIANLLDLKISDATKGKKSLDDVLKSLYKTYYKGKNRGFTEDELKETIEKVAGQDLSDFFDSHIYGTENIDYKAYFQLAGVDIKDENKEVSIASFGASIKDEDGRLVVKSVTRGTSSYESGINVNDEIVAFGTYRVDKKEFEKLFKMVRIGDKIDLTVSRDGIIKTIYMKVLEDNKVNFSLTNQSTKNKKQKRVYERWLRSGS